MADQKPKLTVDELVSYARAYIDSAEPGSPPICTFIKKCSCGVPGCKAEFAINVIPIDNVTYSATITIPTRIH